MPVMKRYDIAVVGGGIAGVAAAIQAARFGRRVALIEKNAFTGGLATAGLINVYLPLCDGNGTQVSFGIVEELLHASLRYGPGDVPPGWRNEQNGAERKRFVAVFSPASFALALDELLEDAGVDLWLDSRVCALTRDGGRIASIAVENDSGRIIVEAGEFIDASGSALLARLAGLDCRDSENYFSLWSLDFNRGDLQMFYGPVYGDGKPTGALDDAALAELGLSLEQLGSMSQRGISGKQTSEYLLFTRRTLRARLRRLYQSGAADRHDFYPAKLPLMPQYRKIYYAVGRNRVRDDGAWCPVADSIGIAADWRKAGMVYEISYGALCPVDGPVNLHVAGRCVDSDPDAWEVTRVIPCAAVTGQAAGVAAAFPGTSVSDIQMRLRQSGVRLHLPETGLSYRRAEAIQ